MSHPQPVIAREPSRGGRLVAAAASVAILAGALAGCGGSEPTAVSLPKAATGPTGAQGAQHQGAKRNQAGSATATSTTGSTTSPSPTTTTPGVATTVTTVTTTSSAPSGGNGSGGTSPGGGGGGGGHQENPPNTGGKPPSGGFCPGNACD